MKHIWTLCLGLLWIMPSWGQQALWVNAGGNSNETQWQSVVLMDDGGSISAGYGESGNMTFSPLSLSVGGSDAVYLGRADANGQYQWVSSISVSSCERAVVAELSPASVILAAKVTGSSFDLGNGVTGNFPPGVTSGIILAKYDRFTGDAQWLELIPGAHQLGDIATRNAKIYVTGEYRGSFSAGSLSLPTSPMALGSFLSNGFLVQYDSTGTATWARHMACQTSGTNFAFVRPREIAAGALIYLAGQHQEQMQAGSFFLSQNSGSGNDSSDIFVLAYNYQGDVIWAKSSVGKSYQDVSGLDITSDGSLWLSGGLSSDFDFGGGTVQKQTGLNTFFASFLLMLDAQGNYLWNHSSNAEIYDVSTDEQGGLFAVGSWNQPDTTVNIGDSLYSVGAGQYSNGMFGFVTKLDSLGNPGWLTAYESQLTSSFWWQYFGSVDAGKNGMVAMSGVFGQNAVWPGQGTFAGAGEDHLAAVLFDGTWAPPAFPLDVVWPGDANYDGSVNALDLLSVGVAFASTGPVRPNASLNWQGQPCYDWNGSFASGVNYKHGDTNGDGIINASDTLALELNYSLSPATNTASSGGPLLFTQFAQDSIEVGDTVNLEILLGTASIPANLYGLAFSLHYDSTLIDAESIVAGFQGSWLGMPGTELLTMAQNRPDSSRIDIALTRTDQMPVAGYGLIAHLTIIMVDDLTAKDYLAEPLSFTLGEVYGVDADGNELGFGWESDSIILVEEIIDSTTTHLPGGPSARMALYPQPSDQLLQVNWGPHQATSWKVSDLLGRELMKSQGTFDDLKIPTDQLPAGTYLLQIDTSLGIQAARFRVQHP